MIGLGFWKLHRSTCFARKIEGNSGAPSLSSSLIRFETEHHPFVSPLLPCCVHFLSFVWVPSIHILIELYETVLVYHISRHQLWHCIKRINSAGICFHVPFKSEWKKNKKGCLLNSVHRVLSCFIDYFQYIL